MHLFVLMRGRKMDVERTIQDLNGKYVSFEHKTHGKGFLNIMCNPIIPCELIFPKEHLSCIVNTLGGLKGQETTRYLDFYKRWLRRLLHLKPIENIDENALKLPIHLENTEIFGVGIKDDKEFEDGTEYI